MKRSFTISLIIIGVVLTFLVFYNVGLWWMISLDSSKTFNEMKYEYQSHYPQYLQNLTLLTLIDTINEFYCRSVFIKPKSYRINFLFAS